MVECDRKMERQNSGAVIVIWVVGIIGNICKPWLDVVGQCLFASSPLQWSYDCTGYMSIAAINYVAVNVYLCFCCYLLI